MIKITKKEFESALIDNKSCFIDVTRNLIDSEELQSIARKILKDDENGNVQWRTAQKYGNGLRFSTGSILDTYSKYSKHVFFKKDCDNSTVYIASYNYYNNFDYTVHYKYMYYLIKN